MQVRMIFLTLILAMLISGCQTIEMIQPTQTPTPASIKKTIQLTSPAFTEGALIPEKYTCEGEDVSPPLAWSGVPAATQSLALIVTDPDAPVGIWFHWVLYNIPVDQVSLAEGVEGVGVDGYNSFRKTGYDGPCPPPGQPHHYHFKLYALDSVLHLPEGETRAELEEAMAGHILAYGELIGQFGR